MSAIMRQFVRRVVTMNAMRSSPAIVSSNLTAFRLLSNKMTPPDNTTFVKDKENQTSERTGLHNKVNRPLFDNLVRTNKVVVFMKGTPKAPRCGFSNAVVQIFRMHGVEYDAHDVLASDELREGIKIYTDWPTIPQVFINGEFVGGCDILLEMHQNGELIEELKKAGIISELLKIHEETEKREAQALKEKNKKNNKDKQE